MDKAGQKTGIIYARVSSQEQVSNTSLEKQVRECQAYARREGIEIITDPFIEEGESAKSANRTKFQEALAFVSKSRPTFFIVYKLDRFARNQDDHVVTRTFLRKYGTELRSATEIINETSIGRLQEGILSVFAEFDNNIRSERSRGGMVENVRKGIWQSQAPIGYRRLTKGGNIVIDEEYAPYIRLAFEEYAKGTFSYRSLARFLKERGFRTRSGKQPFPQLIEKLLRNPIYYGLIRAFGEENIGTFPPIVSEELFWKCQSRSKGKFFARSKRHTENPDFPLRRFTECSECGVSLTGSSSTGRKGIKYPYYHHQKQGCSLARFISKKTLEQNFVEYLREVSPNKKYEKVFKAVVMDIWQTNYKRLDSENEKLRREISALEIERQRIFKLHLRKTYTDEEFSEQKDRINAVVQEKKLLLEDKRIEEFDMEEALDFCFQLVRDSPKTWLELEGIPSYRTRFQNQLFPGKVTYDGKKFGTKKMSLVYELNQPKTAETSTLVSHPLGLFELHRPKPHQVREWPYMLGIASSRHVRVCSLSV